MRSRGMAEGSNSHLEPSHSIGSISPNSTRRSTSGGMHARARGHNLERQLLAFRPAKNDIVSWHSHHLTSCHRLSRVELEAAASFSKSSLSLVVSLGGTTILSLTYWSPRPPSRLLSPWPRNLSLWPPWAPAGLSSPQVRRASDTVTFAPRAASQGATGRSISISSRPTMWNSRCGSIRTRRKRSPGGRAIRARFTLSCQSNHRTIAHARRNGYVKRFRATNGARAAAGWTDFSIL